MRSLRLQAISHYVSEGEVVADVGCDHAFLPIALLTDGKVEKAIGIDVNSLPLASAEKNAKEAGFGSDRLVLRLGNGLEPLLPGEATLVTMAGMGATLMIRLLEQSPEVVRGLKRLILCPNTDPWQVRKWAKENNWRVFDEDVVQENGRFYEIIVLEPGLEREYSEEDLYFGPKLLEKSNDVIAAYYAVRKEFDEGLILKKKQAKKIDSDLQSSIDSLQDLWKGWERLYHG